MSAYRPNAEEAVPAIVTLNGEAREIAHGVTVSGLLADLEIEGDRVAVEVDREIVPRGRWASTTLVAGTTIEVVHFVGGG